MANSKRQTLGKYERESWAELRGSLKSCWRSTISANCSCDLAKAKRIHVCVCVGCLKVCVLRAFFFTFCIADWLIDLIHFSFYNVPRSWVYMCVPFALRSSALPSSVQSAGQSVIFQLLEHAIHFQEDDGRWASARQQQWKNEQLKTQRGGNLIWLWVSRSQLGCPANQSFLIKVNIKLSIIVVS